MTRFTTRLLPAALALAALLGTGCNNAKTGDGGGGSGGSPAGTDAPKAKSATFDATHKIVVKVPETGGKFRIWVAMPQRNESLQDVSNFKVECAWPHTIKTDAHGNEFVYVEGEATTGQKTIDIVETFRVTRREQLVHVDASKTRALTDEERKQHAAHLGGGQQEIIDDKVKEIAAKLRDKDGNPVRTAKAVYDWVLGNIEYWVKDPSKWKASGKGSSVYTLEQCTGNCTDIHAAYIVLARAAGVPCRAVYGSFFKTPLDGVADKDQSYHCWVEFFAPNLGWVPLDVALADLFVDEGWMVKLDEKAKTGAVLTTAAGNPGENPELREWYFGNLEERRVTWHRERDLDVGQASAPLLWLPRAHVECNGKEHTDFTRLLTFKEVK